MTVRIYRQEAAIARTPKTTTKATTQAATGARKAPAPAKAAATKPKLAAKPAPKAPAKAAPKAVAKPAAKVATKPKATAKPAAKPKATPQLKASAAAAAKRDAAPAAPRPVRSPRARAPKVAPALLDRLVAAAAKSLEDDKAENIVVLDVTGRADYADRLVIATGLADRQITAMATHLQDAFEKEGLKLRRDAIQGSPDWVLIDAGDLVVHLFKPEARGLYALERMWGPDSPAPDAPEDRTALPDDGFGGSTATEDDDE